MAGGSSTEASRVSVGGHAGRGAMSSGAQCLAVCSPNRSRVHHGQIPVVAVALGSLQKQ